MYVDPATVEPVTELPAAVAEVVADRTPAGDVRPAAGRLPAMPAALRVLAEDARHEDDHHLSRRSLAVALLGRGWDPATTSAASGLSDAEVVALAGVRRPGSASSSVADDLVAARLAAQAG